MACDELVRIGFGNDQVATGANLEGVGLATRVQRPFDLLLGIVALILLVICVNLASPTLARAIRRRPVAGLPHLQAALAVWDYTPFFEELRRSSTTPKAASLPYCRPGMWREKLGDQNLSA